jgi:hypothetical protein
MKNIEFLSALLFKRLSSKNLKLLLNGSELFYYKSEINRNVEINSLLYNLNKN